MFKRSWISVTKNRVRTVILLILLFVIANLVLSSITIKSATQEAMDQARISLGAEITLTTDRTEVFSFIREYRDIYGTRPPQDEISSMLLPITSSVAFGLAESEYVVDYNLSFSTNSYGVDFLPALDASSLDTANESKLSVVGTYNVYMLDQFGDNGTYYLTDDSANFSGDDSGVVIISENLAYLNDLSIGDVITISSKSQATDAVEDEDSDSTEYVTSLEIIGLFNSLDMLEDSGKNILDNEVYMPLSDALYLNGQDSSSEFTVTTVKYYLDDPLNIEIFTEQAADQYEEIASGQLTFSDVSYDAVTEPLQNVSDFSDIILYAVVIAAIVILTLLIVNTLKDRKYEIGVLLSLGESKLKISIQYLLELILIAVIAFTIATISSNTVSDRLGDMLLTNEITDLESTETTTTSGGKGGGTLSISPLGDIEYIEEIDVAVSLVDFVITLGIGVAIIVFSSLTPTLYITRYQPKRILSSRN